MGNAAIVHGQLRHLLAPRVYTLPLVRAIGRTMVQGKNYGPQITVKRIATRLHLQFQPWLLAVILLLVDLLHSHFWYSGSL